jgi:hypothetical protein
MNTQEKEKQQKLIVLTIQGIEFAVKKAVSTKDTFRAKIEELSLPNEMYSDNYLETEISKEKKAYSAQMQKAYDDMVERLEQLRNLIHDRDVVLDLGNPAMTNALSLIQTVGGNLTYEEAVQINANFVHDQSALRALQSAYKRHGLVSPGNIDNMIYDLNSTIDNLKELAYHSFVQEGSLNYFAGKFSKFAKLEGQTIESTPDNAGVIEAMRAGAGL